MQAHKTSPYIRRFMPMFTLMRKELHRLWETPLQAFVSPVITSSLYLFIFGLSLGSRLSVVPQFSYAQFVVPGLIMMVVINNSFMHAAFGLFFPRYIGHIVDLLVTPITPLQFVFAYALPSMLRGLLVGAMVYLISIFFAPMSWPNPLGAMIMLILASLVFSFFGFLAGLYSNSFETLSMYSTFIVLPLTYLGGMFYPVSLLPPIWASLSKLNPIYYLIDGFRQSLLGPGDTPLGLDLMTTMLVATALGLWCYWLVKKGYRLRS